MRLLLSAGVHARRSGPPLCSLAAAGVTRGWVVVDLKLLMTGAAGTAVTELLDGRHGMGLRELVECVAAVPEVQDTPVLADGTPEWKISPSGGLLSISSVRSP